ncbi:aldo/keto reductase [Colletotrichum graminicola]|uniref:Aldo/keto reductase n=1 Tax=Colletotrichum graminicola (strain M1.001 / M2 / FGSC 10212) TaxID=645133 RepID=E3QMX3_COLGM|nr:aldo/keto reductase [Colletotrichum graminicola M1.001]EFQ32211.1 aldo/keto reductase [Colletotrichum graminicola M1.001]WDK09414.1 aldo/keto reductase [Colletotrichum graminicola]
MTNTVAPIPRLIYGTAWKKSQTAPLVASALSAGFRALDTAASHHYSEEGVGAGLRAWLAQNPTHGVPRSALYIQTKFSPSPSALPIPDQVHASVASSLNNLSVPGNLFAREEAPAAAKDEDGGGGGFYLDCVLLHAPYPSYADTLLAWRALESYVPSRIRTLGISNVHLDELRALCADAAVKPVVVQNRLNPKEAYNTPVRVFCRERGINFQSFWTLTANPPLVRGEAVARVAEGAGVSNEVAMYALVLGLRGVSVLDGTTNEARMKEDLEGVEKVAAWAEGHGAGVWERSLAAFKSVLGDPEGA